MLPLHCCDHTTQDREALLARREAVLAAAEAAQHEAADSAHAELARLQAAARDVGRQVAEAEADYVTGVNRLSELQAEVRARVHVCRPVVLPPGLWRVHCCWQAGSINAALVVDA